MTIHNSTIDDINEIFRLYGMAKAFQHAKGVVEWPIFEQSLVETEIKEQRQWKLVMDNQIACVWTTTFDDPLIWLERNTDPAVYIHRIATNPDFRGNDLVKKIVNWAKKYAIANQKKFIRMDTVGKNTSLINYYKKSGFDFLGMLQLEDTDALPTHYHKANVSLFEIKL